MPGLSVVLNSVVLRANHTTSCRRPQLVLGRRAWRTRAGVPEGEDDAEPARRVSRLEIIVKRKMATIQKQLKACTKKLWHTLPISEVKNTNITIFIIFIFSNFI